jgi:gliding motility-associated-like protein
LDGINDCFTISSSTDTLNCYGLYIYNRWGELLYDGTTDGSCWNGAVRNKGGSASPGVYFFIVYVGGEKKSAGTLTLVR